MQPLAPPMDRATALNLVRGLISRIFGVAPGLVAADTVAADIERWDSLGMATLSLGLERRLNRSLPIEAFVAARSVAELIDIICGVVNAPAARNAAAPDSLRHD